MTLSALVIDLPDDTTYVTRTCAKCEISHTDTDLGFAVLGWTLLRRRLLCPDCLPKKYRRH